MRTRLHDQWLFYLVPYILLVLVRLLLNWDFSQPMVIADEVGYLCNARTLLGIGVHAKLVGVTFYHTGYSVAILPAFLLTRDPEIIYRYVLILNVLYMSALYPILYRLTKHFLSSPWHTAGIAFIVSIYPAFTNYTGLAFPANILLPLYAATILLFYEILRSPGYAKAILLGLAVGALYGVHGRMIVMIPILILFLFIWGWKERLPIQLAGIIFAVTILMTTGIVFLHRYIAAILYENPVGATVGFTELRQRLSAPPLAMAGEMLLNILGQYLYLVLSTYGLFAIGMIALVENIASRKTGPGTGDWKRNHQFLFILLTSAGIFGISAFILMFFHRPDHLIYGRYNECFLPIIMIFGLIPLAEGRYSLKSLVFRAVMVIGSTSILVVVFIVLRGRAMFQGDYNALNIMGVSGYFLLFNQYNLAYVLPFFIVIAGIFFYAARQKFSIALLVLAGPFILLTISVRNNAILPTRDECRKCTALAHDLHNLGGAGVVSYDSAYMSPLSFYSYVYLLPQTRFEYFNSARHEVPPSGTVISGSDWGDAGRFNALYVGREEDADNALWILPMSEHPQSIDHRRYSDTIFGNHYISSLYERGFHSEEKYLPGAVGRWTKDTALIIIPVDSILFPRYLGFTGSTMGGHFTMRVNGATVCDEQLVAGNVARLWPLVNVPKHRTAEVKIISRDARPPGPADARVLGVFVKGMRFFNGELLTPEFKSQREEYRSSINLVKLDEDRGEGRLTVEVQVRNRSTVIWPVVREVGDMGAVRIGIQWWSSQPQPQLVYEDRIDFSRALNPDSTEIVVSEIHTNKPGGHALPKGIYNLKFGLLQESVCWFYDQGDTVITVPLTIQ